MLYFWKKDKVLKKIFYLLFCFCLIILVLSGCEKDDICAEETPTTPELILRFYDLASQNDTKNVTGLFAYGLDDENNVIPFNGLTIGTNDSIAIPLRVDTNSTRFVLHKDFEIDDNGTPDDNTDDFLLGNPEVINVNYEREDVYVSRACGYKTIFNNISFSVDLDGDNWIINSEIIKPNVEYEIGAHVKIYH
jgi:hypothetical protein